jgi:hypothetical protein
MNAQTLFDFSVGPSGASVHGPLEPEARRLRKNARQRARRLANPEKIRAIEARSYQKNKNKKTLSRRDFRLRNLEKERKAYAAWYQKNKEKKKQYSRQYRAKNREAIIKKSAKHRAENKDFVNRYRREWMAKNWETVYQKQKTNTNSWMAKCIRTRIINAFKGNAKSGSTEELIGCSFEFLKLWLESKWKPGMSWGNYGAKGWHIDHIRPLASFDLTDAAQQRLACHFLNLQPLWAHENLSKGDTWDSSP